MQTTDNSSTSIQQTGIPSASTQQTGIPSASTQVTEISSVMAKVQMFNSLSPSRPTDATIARLPKPAQKIADPITEPPGDPITEPPAAPIAAQVASPEVLAIVPKLFSMLQGKTVTGLPLNQVIKHKAVESNNVNWKANRIKIEAPGVVGLSDEDYEALGKAICQALGPDFFGRMSVAISKETGIPFLSVDIVLNKRLTESPERLEAFWNPPVCTCHGAPRAGGGAAHAGGGAHRVSRGAARAGGGAHRASGGAPRADDDWMVPPPQDDWMVPPPGDHAQPLDLKAVLGEGWTLDSKGPIQRATRKFPK